MISPSKFIPIAEDSGLILPIGTWVLREACTQAKAWADAGLPSITVAVNVSAIQLGEDNFLEGLSQILSETRLEAGILELEVTESVLMKHANLAASLLQTLKGKGVRVSIDDFGTGYSSLSYLREFPLDALKIDQSFIRQVEMTLEDSTIVAAIVSMAHSLNLRVIAEGVETTASLQLLKTLGCDEAQGNYFSRPVSADEFAGLLSADAAATPCS